MKRLDSRQRLSFCDFSRPDSDTTSIGFAPSELGRVIHARWADGRVITGVDVFRAMLEAVGLGLLAKLKRLSLVEPLVLRGYSWFARNRLQLTGRLIPCPEGACDSRHSVEVERRSRSGSRRLIRGWVGIEGGIVSEGVAQVIDGRARGALGRARSRWSRTIGKRNKKRNPTGRLLSKKVIRAYTYWVWGWTGPPYALHSPIL